jgi:hypothetical protein
MTRPKALSELLAEAFDKANAECPLSERMHDQTSNQSRLGELMRETDALNPKAAP